MATTPRYIATNVADAVTYVRASIEQEVWFQVFDSDRDGEIETGSTDETEFARAVARAETKVDEAFGSSYGAPWNSTAFAALPEGMRDSIRECVLELLPYERVKFRPSMSDEKRAPYRVLWKDAKERLAKLASDADAARLPAAGPPAVTLAAGMLSADAEDAGTTWQNIASGTITA